MSIYQEIILDHYRSPHNHGPLPDPTNTVAVSNPLCGDKLTLQVNVVDDVVEAVAFSGEGCAISQASASLLTDHVKGKSVEELRKLPKEFILDVLGVQLSPNRLKCAWLSWEALMKVLA